MVCSRNFDSAGKALLLGFVMCCCSGVFAQGHDDHAPRTVLTRPDGVDDKDALKDFHQALAVQATSEQLAEFHGLRTATDSAKSEVQKLSHASSPASNAELDRALAAARSQTRKFTDGFSDKQRAGLKEQIRTLDRADAALADQQRKVDQALPLPTIPAPELANDLGMLDKAIDDFSAQQLSLARQMGIVLVNADDVTFKFPAVKSTVLVSNQPLQVTVSSLLSETGGDAAQRTFRLEMMEDLTDFQQNITTVLGAALDSENRCGERLTVKRAMLMPSPPAANLNLQLHYERWACLRITGQSTSTEIAEGDGDVQIRLTPTLREGALQLETDFGRVDAGGMMGDSLHTGDLGHDLREKVARVFLAAMHSASDLKTSLPPALQGSAALQTGKFEDDGAGDLSITLEGRAQVSPEQAKALADQLNQTLSAEGSGAK